jgi:hypothetical protein
MPEVKQDEIEEKDRQIFELKLYVVLLVIALAVLIILSYRCGIFGHTLTASAEMTFK